MTSRQSAHSAEKKACCRLKNSAESCNVSQSLHGLVEVRRKLGGEAQALSTGRVLEAQRLCMQCRPAEELDCPSHGLLPAATSRTRADLVLFCSNRFNTIWEISLCHLIGSPDRVLQRNEVGGSAGAPGVGVVAEDWVADMLGVHPACSISATRPHA